MALLEGKER
jgi:hypothetical protein